MSNTRKLSSGVGLTRRWTAPIAVIGVGGLVVGSVGAADAATGGNIRLGKSNHETRTATLSNSKGIPLSLKAKPGSPPLKVNSSKLVPKLNANFVGGVPASKLQRRITGSCGTAIASVAVSGAATCAAERLIFTSDGSVTIPKGVTDITGELWAGGGGGGAAYLTDPSQYGGAGGEGGYERVLIPVHAGEVLNVVVGAAGHGSDGHNSDPNGTAGGSTELKSTGGSVLAGATGGAGGVSFYCGSDAAGGDPMALASGVIGAEARSGGAGHCNGPSVGGAGFAGAGGAAAVVNGADSPGSDGGAGRVIITFAQ